MEGEKMLSHVVLDERIVKCEKILEENPNSQIFAALADAKRKKGELDKAFRICRQGLRVHCDYGAGHLIMARINFDRRMYDWAETELQEAIQLDGRTRATDLLQAEIYIKQKKFEQAKAIIAELASTESENIYFKGLLEEIKKGSDEEKRRKLEMELLYKSQSGEAVLSRAAATRVPPLEPLSPEETLKGIAGFSGIQACFFTDQEGMMIDAELPEYFDRDSYAALSAEIYRFVKDNMGRIKYGAVRQVLIELAREKVWMVRVQERILVMVLASNANLGSLKLKLTNILKQMVAA
jgi:predicted regulator of Ras-like GTPase activity (Roadblock/LC7/MglB family)